jgi:hypothetical protein
MTDQQELLVQDIENACIKAFEAGAQETDILFRVEELLQAMMWSCTEKLEDAEDHEAQAIVNAGGSLAMKRNETRLTPEQMKWI